MAEEIITKQTLLRDIETFLSERKEAKGSGWPEVKLEEERQLNAIIHALICLKWEEDVDGDLPIEWETVDRTKYYHPFLHYCKSEYPHKKKTLGDYISLLTHAQMNLSTAQSEVEKISKYVLTLINQDESLKNSVIRKG